MLTVVLERAKVRPGQLVLDLGCGGGRHAFACLKAGANVVALDADHEEVRGVAGMVSAMREATEIDTVVGSVVAGDAMHLPIADAVFDRVIAAEVLEHVPDDTSAIAELVRVLRPGGVFALSVPRYWPERVNWALSREYHAFDGGHLRIYRRRALVRRCEELGLRLSGAHHAHSLHSPYWWLRCAVGVKNDQQALVAGYHRFLVWDLVNRPPLIRAIERVLDPVVGKSLVLYFDKPDD